MRHETSTMIRSMAWDLGLPLAGYYALHALGADDVTALLAGTVAAGVRLAWGMARARSVNPFSAIMATLFGVGLIFTLLTGDARLLLVKHSVISATIGIAFLVTALRGRKPLTLSALRNASPQKADEYQNSYDTNPAVREAHRIASFVWAGGLLIEATTRIVLVYLLPVHVMVGLSTVLTVVATGGLTAWTARFMNARKSRAELALAA